ncbi:hypothetical protein Hanom_Chr04g00364011 [Helianthus anomalus]
MQSGLCRDRRKQVYLGFLRDIWTDPVLYPSLTKSWCLTWLFGTSNPTNIKVRMLILGLRFVGLQVILVLLCITDEP